MPLEKNTIIQYLKEEQGCLSIQMFHISEIRHKTDITFANRRYKTKAYSFGQ